MRTSLRSILACGLVALACSPAMAQQGRGGRGGFGGGGFGVPLNNESVQKELKLDSDQVSKVTSLADELRTKMMSELQSLDREERMAKGRELAREHSKNLHKGLAEILKPEQLKRYKQIELQQRGAEALVDEEVAKTLKLTDEQTSKIRAALEDASAKRRELFQSAQGDRQAAFEKIAALQKETKEKAHAALTDEQKTALGELLGSPFEIVRQPR